MARVTEEQIEKWFTPHFLTEEKREAVMTLREAAKVFAWQLIAVTPTSADQNAALRKLRECVMTATAAIALEGQ